MLNKKLEIGIEDHIKVLEDSAKCSELIFQHYIRGILESPSQIPNSDDLLYNQTVNRELKNKQRILKDFKHHSNINLASLERNTVLKENLNELNYEVKLVTKDRDSIKEEKMLIEKELIRLKGSDFLIKYSSNNFNNLNVDCKTNRNSLENKYSSNMSAFSTQLSIMEFKKDIDERKKVIKYMTDQVTNIESEIVDTKKSLNNKSLTSQKLNVENQALSARMAQKEIIIKQLRAELISIKEKKKIVTSHSTQINAENNENKSDGHSVSRDVSETKVKATETSKEKKGFFGFVKSIFGKKN